MVANIRVNDDIKKALDDLAKDLEMSDDFDYSEIIGYLLDMFGPNPDELNDLKEKIEEIRKITFGDSG